jgi:hypothetical protein
MGLRRKMKKNTKREKNHSRKPLAPMQHRPVGGNQAMKRREHVGATGTSYLLFLMAFALAMQKDAAFATRAEKPLEGVDLECSALELPAAKRVDSIGLHCTLSNSTGSPVLILLEDFDVAGPAGTEESASFDSLREYKKVDALFRNLLEYETADIDTLIRPSLFYACTYDFPTKIENLVKLLSGDSMDIYLSWTPPSGVDAASEGGWLARAKIVVVNVSELAEKAGEFDDSQYCGELLDILVHESPIVDSTAHKLNAREIERSYEPDEEPLRKGNCHQSLAWYFDHVYSNEMVIEDSRSSGISE